MKLSARLTVSALALTLGVLTSGANAATVISQSYSGSFPANISGTLPNQDTVLELSLSLASTSNFAAFTTSYATGGFQPNLTLYNSSGIALINLSVAPAPGAMADPTTGQTDDAYFTQSDLAAGMYTLTLSDIKLQQSSSATNLSDGFTANYGNGTTFVDLQGNTRTGAYALTIDAAGASSSTPEPATVALLGPALLAAWFLRKRMQSVN